MKRSLPALLVALGLLAGCGSQTKTVTVAGAPHTSPSTTTQPPASAHGNTPPSTTGTSSTPTSTTRTAPEPTFSEQEAGSGGSAAAAATVRAKGYTPNSTSEYHSGQTLSVLVGTRTGSGDGYGQQAFFFKDGRYIGTDTKEPSAKLKVVSQGDTEVAIAYPLYRKSDPLCCPGGGQKVVHFALDNGRLQALDPIPPASSASGLGRN